MTDYLELPNNGTTIRLNFYWLRDHCRCEKCFDKNTSQRKFNFMDISLDIRPKSHVVKDGQLTVVCKYILVQNLNVMQTVFQHNELYPLQGPMIINLCTTSNSFTTINITYDYRFTTNPMKFYGIKNKLKDSIMPEQT